MAAAGYAYAMSNFGFPELLFLLAIVCTFVGFKIAVSRNHAGWIGAVLGFFLGLIGLLIIALVPRGQANPPTSPTESSPRN